MNYFRPKYINYMLSSYNQKLSKAEHTVSLLFELVDKPKEETKETEKEKSNKTPNTNGKPEIEDKITVNTVRKQEEPFGLNFSDGYVYNCGIDKNNGNKLYLLQPNPENGNWSWWYGIDVHDLGSTKILIGGQQIDINSNEKYVIPPIAYGDIIKVNYGSFQTLDLQINGLTVARMM